MAKILLVEDEINIASFIERGLKEFGHSVTVCHDGDTGWKILQDKPFDLLILICQHYGRSSGMGYDSHILSPQFGIVKNSCHRGQFIPPVTPYDTGFPE